MIKEKYFENQTFKKEVCISSDLKGTSFSRVIFESCDLSQSLLMQAKLIGCKFLGCNLSLIKLDGSRLQEVEFEDCKLVGVNFSKVDPLFFSVKFKNCLIDLANFSDLQLKGTSFLNCLIREAHFSHTNLAETVFTGSDLAGTTFHNCNLSKAVFTDALNYSIDPTTNVLKRARFSSPGVLSLLDHLGIIID
jgi:fluoroquinolone resistance protein